MLLRATAALLATLLVLPPVYPVESSQIVKPCGRHMAMFNLSPGDDPLSDIRFTHLPKEALPPARNPHPASVRSYFALPVTLSDFDTIYGTKHTLTPQREKEIGLVKQALVAQKRPDVDRNLTQNTLTRVLSREPATYLILVGHNEGGKFVFLDGSREDIGDFAATAAKYRKVAVFISCSAQRQVQKLGVATRTDLTVAEALAIEAGLRTYFDSSKTLNIEQVAARLRTEESHAKFKYRTRYLIMKASCAVISGILVAIIVEALDPCDDSAKPC